MGNDPLFLQKQIRALQTKHWPLLQWLPTTSYVGKIHEKLRNSIYLPQKRQAFQIWRCFQNDWILKIKLSILQSQFFWFQSFALHETSSTITWKWTVGKRSTLFSGALAVMLGEGNTLSLMAMLQMWLDSQKQPVNTFVLWSQFCGSKVIHPGRLTWNLQITHLERKMIWTKHSWLCSMLIFGGVSKKNLRLF